MEAFEETQPDAFFSSSIDSLKIRLERRHDSGDDITIKRTRHTTQKKKKNRRNKQKKNQKKERKKKGTKKDILKKKTTTKEFVFGTF